jgi:hypothetical protein
MTVEILDTTELDEGMTAQELAAGMPDPDEKEALLEAEPVDELDRMGLPTADARALERIARARDLVRKARVEWEDLDRQAKASKKRLEARQEDLEATIDAVTAPDESMPLFDRPDLDALPAEDATWREVPLSSLGIAEPVLAVMAEQAPPILTVGHLADWTKGGRNLLTDLRGVGQAKGQAIELALDEFWARRSGDAPSPAS